MDSLIPLLYEFYITPNIEDDELLSCVSKLYKELTPTQQDLCGQVCHLYANKSFLLGVRTGANLERFLQETPQA